MVTRRRVLRTGLTTAAAMTVTGVALRPMLAAGQPRTAVPLGRAGWGPNGDTGTPFGADADLGSNPGDGAGDTADDAATTTLFDEIYRGRHIQGFGSPEPSGVRILIDGRPLEMMRRVDGSWISMANHYQPYLTPLATARGAVDVIGRAQLSTAAAHHH